MSASAGAIRSSSSYRGGAVQRLGFSNQTLTTSIPQSSTKFQCIWVKYTSAFSIQDLGQCHSRNLYHFTVWNFQSLIYHFYQSPRALRIRLPSSYSNDCIFPSELQTVLRLNFFPQSHTCQQNGSISVVQSRNSGGYVQGCHQPRRCERGENIGPPHTVILLRHRDDLVHMCLSLAIRMGPGRQASIRYQLRSLCRLRGRWFWYT